MTAIVPQRSRLGLYLDLIRWDRPAGWLLLLWPTLSALWMAKRGFPGWHLLTVFVLGTFLMRSAGCCINDVADQEFDRHVKRTAQRPVTSGAVSVREALVLAAVLVLAAFGLVLTTNAPTVVWSFAALAITLVYPYAKRHVAMPQAVLGVAFSAGIPMAFTAIQGSESWLFTAIPGDDGMLLAALEGSVPALGWWLVLGNLFWVLAYDTEYAMVDRDDDLRIGIRTSAITLGRFDVPAIVLFYLLFLGIWTVALQPYALGPMFHAAIGIALVQVFWHWSLIRRRTREGCFHAFRVNHWLGLTVFAGIAAGFALQKSAA
ncbi:4-hydroxybenzoate octaprenyltransferase [Xylophilus sp. GW821-FHT01B05]